MSREAIDLLNKIAADLGLSPRHKTSFIHWRIPKDWQGTKYAFGYTPWKTEDEGQVGYFALKYRVRKDGSMRLIKKVRFGRRKVAKARSLTWHRQYYEKGCLYHCYRDGCWANKRLAHRLGKMLKCQLCYDFIPHFHPERLKRIPSEPKIFVVAHGDLFAPWVPSEVIHKILKVCRATPKETWFFETKNPQRYLEFLGSFPKNTVLSTTIETNRRYTQEVMGLAPQPIVRYRYISVIALQKFPVHISIEPVMDFDLITLVDWMKVIHPVKVAVGYDSLHNSLPEPPKEKTFKLISELEKFTDVEKKDLRE